MADFNQPIIQPDGPGVTAAPVAGTSQVVDPFSAIAAKKLQLLQQQKLAQALLAQQGENFSKGQMVGGIYVPPSVFGQIGRAGTPLAEALLAKKALKNEADLTTEEAKVRQAILQGINPQNAMQYVGSIDEPTSKVAQAFVSKIPKTDISIAPNGQPIETGMGATGPYVKPLGGQTFEAPKETWKVVGPSAHGGVTLESSLGDRKVIDQDTARTMVISGPNALSKALAPVTAQRIEGAAVKAAAAEQGLAAADRIDAAIAKGAFTGTFATPQQWLARLGDTVKPGMTPQEQLAEGQNLISGLSELTLQGRKEMRGEGAITEAEGKLAEDAKSGRRTLSPVELKQLTNAARRSAAYFKKINETNVELLRRNKETEMYAPYYESQQFPGLETTPTPASPTPAAPAASNVPMDVEDWLLQYEDQGDQ